MLKLSVKDSDFIESGAPLNELFFFENVQAYEFVEFSCLNLVIPSNPGFPLRENAVCADNHRQVYILLDTINSDNFGHFFFETLVFLPLINRLKKKIPNLKFLYRNNKEFKNKIAAHYGLLCETEIKEKHNYLGVFPLLTSLNTNKNLLYYRSLLEGLHHEIHRDNLSYFDKDLQIVYFKRHLSKDNFPYAGRPNVYAEEIEDFVKSHPNSLCFESEENSDWSLEISLVRRCRILIVPEGSAFTVLGFHSSNSTIITLGALMTSVATKRYEKTKEIYRLLSLNNSIYHLESKDERYKLSDIYSILGNRLVTL